MKTASVHRDFQSLTESTENPELAEGERVRDTCPATQTLRLSSTMVNCYAIKDGPNNALARIFHELLSRDHEDGLATGQLVPRYRGIGSEAYLNGTSQGPTPEDARKDGHMRGRSK